MLYKSHLLCSTPWQIEMNFRQDLEDMALSTLSTTTKKRKYTNGKSVFYDYSNLLHRKVSSVPRNVKRSSDLVVPKKFKRVVAILERLIRAGRDITPFMSRKTKNPEYDDGLLNDWGIYHFHLSTQVESDGFVKRTDHVLMVRFDNQTAYFIQIYPHKPYIWYQTEMIMILHKNWPDSISKFRAYMISSAPLSEDVYAVLRKKHINSCVTMEDGTTYLPIGGGCAANGYSASVLLHVDRFKNTLCLHELFFHNNAEIIFEAASDFLGKKIENMHLKFIAASAREFVYLDTTNKIIFRFSLDGIPLTMGRFDCIFWFDNPDYQCWYQKAIGLVPIPRKIT